MHLIVVASETVKHEEVAHIGDSNSWQSYGPSAFDQFVAPTTPIQHGTNSHDRGNSGDEGTEACLRLPYAEAFMIVEEIWLFLNLVCLIVAQETPQ